MRRYPNNPILDCIRGNIDERIGKTFLDARGIIDEWNGYISQKDFIYKCTCDDGVHVFFEKPGNSSGHVQDVMSNLVDVTGMDAGEIEKYYLLARACGAAGINTKISLRSSNYGELFPDFFKKRGYLFEKFTQYPGCLEAVNECIESGNAAKLWDIRKIMEDRSFLEEKTAAVAPLVSRSRRETEKHTPQAESGGQNMVNIIEGWAPTSFQPERLKTKPHQTEDAQSSMTASDMLKDLQKLSNLGGFRAFCKTLLAETELLIRGQTEPLQDLVIKIGSYLVAPDSQRYPLFVSGPTGCGKTYSVKTLCGKMGIPFVEIATPDLSPASYKGTTIQDVIYDAVSAVSGDEGRPERMIVYLDEFGKILDRGGRDRSLSHEIQNGFLKLVEPGAKAKSDRRHEGIKEVDLKDVLIILSDALSSMEGEVSRAKLIEAGFIPELAGRIQLVQPFRQLTAEDYLDILENAKGTTLESKAKALAAIGLRLGITPEAKWELARMAAQDKGGARALGHMVNNVIEAELKDKVFLSRDGDPNLRISPEVVRRHLQKDNGRDLKQAIRVCK